MPTTDDLRIANLRDLCPPSQVMAEFVRTPPASTTVTAARHAVHQILHGQDDRLLVVIGPCSIHDPQAALDYAERLLGERRRLGGELEIVMRVYFEKPRTTVGWKGLINDPDLDGSFNINKGLRLARSLLLQINEMGLPAGVEFLDVITPQYLADLVSWGAIGARTTESQIHRELASGLSCPVGFKNGTGGDVKIAVDACRAAAQPHHFLAVSKAGHSAIATTTGNEDCHVVLRGGTVPNYDATSVTEAATAMVAAGLRAALVIDASHANSGKDPAHQPAVIDSIASQVAAGERQVVGVMVESHLVAGRQDLVAGRPLVYGQSVTDGCIDWETSVGVLDRLAHAVRARRKAPVAASTAAMA